ncbi:sushi, von Willebrand factor type A, EGF and pentraxin domain-containing protein 1-like [Mya arenaria]|uniref:sushi, von Willebrand factor type A, EGF and pentraxin domain-containing protein 1-like n=1 Tax=Mya arenaria TaxID=6604 RepID=UPI0022E8857E|nr:sushi, von Willebrand factor type A, EGF and pentraxin domain-containing protein 1-like [Mya arenaria]
MTDVTITSISLTSIIITCNPGFEMVSCVDGGGSEAVTVTCQCSALTAPANGRVDKNYETTPLGGTATYSCDAGYTLSDTATRYCVSGTGWVGSGPTCDASLIDCGSPSEPENGFVFAVTTTVGSTALYSCEIGNELVGDSTRTCGASGWGYSEPFCEACTNNGGECLTVANTACDEGGTGVCECNAGYTVLADSSACTYGLLQASSISDGWLEVTDGSATATSLTSISFTCDNGFDLVGTATINCVDSTGWETGPTCHE